MIAGDLVDRGPAILDTVELVMAMIGAGDASAVIGNHDDKLLRWLRGRPVKVNNGLEESVSEVEERSRSYRVRLEEFLASLPSHLVLDDGSLVVAHAGLPERLHGTDSTRARDFAMYGAVRPGRDEWGLPIRLEWAADYSGEARVVYGHTPVVTPVWWNRTIDIDTGCVFGNTLTALRYPELELVAVPARGVYRRRAGRSANVDQAERPWSGSLPRERFDGRGGEGRWAGLRGTSPRGTRPAPLDRGSLTRLAW